MKSSKNAKYWQTCRSGKSNKIALINRVVCEDARSFKLEEWIKLFLSVKLCLEA